MRLSDNTPSWSNLRRVAFDRWIVLIICRFFLDYLIIDDTKPLDHSADLCERQISGNHDARFYFSIMMTTIKYWKSQLFYCCLYCRCLCCWLAICCQVKRAHGPVADDQLPWALIRRDLKWIILFAKSKLNAITYKFHFYIARHAAPASTRQFAFAIEVYNFAPAGSRRFCSISEHLDLLGGLNTCRIIYEVLPLAYGIAPRSPSIAEFKSCILRRSRSFILSRLTSSFSLLADISV